MVHTNLLRQRDPVAAGAVLLDVGLELGILLRRPRPFLHARLVAARSPPHGSRSLASCRPVDRSVAVVSFNSFFLSLFLQQASDRASEVSS